MLWDMDFLRLLDQVQIMTKRLRFSHQAGQKYGKYLGSGLEFSDYRPYQAGDDYRYIDWNLYSRLEQLFLKQFIEEKDGIIHFLLDHSTSMGYGQPTKLAYAQRLAGALGYIGLANWDRVGGAFFTSHVTKQLSPAKGTAWATRYFDFLSQIDLGGQTNFTQALGEYGASVQPGLAVILSDFIARDPWKDGVLALVEAGFEVWLIQILSREEIDPSLGADVRFIDSETGIAAEVSLTQGNIDQYKARLEAGFQDLAEFARRYGVLFLRAEVETPVADTIFTGLRQLKGVK